jgi:3-dehydroquinate synthetase
MSNPRTAQLVSGERLPSPADRSCRDLEYVSRGVRSFIRIGAGLGGEVADFVANGGFYRACVITDDHVARLHGAELRACLADAGGPEQYWYSIAPGEDSKTLPRVYECLEEILPFMTRDSLIITLGGGVVGNFGGTVSALLFRGCPFIHLPTTFMAQADSAIGAKQAVNATRAKNAYGAFHAPLGVFDDIRFLDTLPVGEWRNGLAESIKVAVASQPLFAAQLSHLLCRCPRFTDDEIYFLIAETVRPKVNGLTADLEERSALMFLELGHAIGHAIERATQGKVSHGAAISLGMLIEATLGIRLGITCAAVHDLLSELFSTLGLPRRLPRGLGAEQILASLTCSSRRVASGPVFVFATTVGNTVTHSGIATALIREVLTEFVAGV